MAITGRFDADFVSFQAAVEKSIVTLTSMEAGAGKVETSINRVANSLEGGKIVQQATIAAAAVEAIGGVSKLTEAELARVGATAQEAVAKLTALGKDVPAGVQDLADRARGAAEETLRLADAAKKGGEAAEGLGSRITGLVAAAAAAKAAIQGVVAIGVEWVTTAGAQEDASVRLDTALRNAGTATPALTAQYTALASSFEGTTANADELLMEMEALLTVVGGVAPKDMRAALTASTDLAAGLRIDLRSATELMSKALEGNFTALKKHGIAVDELAFKTEGATVVFQAIADKMGGAATAQAATFGGELKRLGNVINNTEETLGGLVARGLKPAVDLFLALPAPVREGTVAVTLLAGAMGTLAVAVAGVAAAAALAAPLLGFSAATAGAAALGGLTAVAGPLAIAIAGVTTAWAAWHAASADSGWVRELSDSFEYASLRMQGFSAREADVIIAQEHVREAAATLAAGLKAVADARPIPASYTEQLAAVVAQVGRLTDAQKAEVLAAKELGLQEDEITKKFGLGHAAIELLTKSHDAAIAAMKKASDEAAASAKKYSDAWGELNSVGEDYAATVATINPKLLEQVQYYLRAGVAIGVVAAAYPALSTAQVTAVAAMDKATLAHAALEAKALLETTRLWDEYDALVGAGSGTAYAQAQAAIDKWYADTVAKNQAALTDTAAFYDAIAALDLKKYAQLETNALAADVRTRTRAQRQAAEDEAKYQFALAHLDDFTAADIEDMRKTADASALAAQMFGQGFIVAADKAKGAIKDVSQAATDAAAKAAALYKAQQDLANYGGVAVPTSASLTAAGIVASTISGATGPGWSPTLANHAAGGPVSAGPAMLHDNEYVVPEGGALVLRDAGGRGSVVVHNYFTIIDTAENLARQSADLVLRTVMAGTQLRA